MGPAAVILLQILLLVDRAHSKKGESVFLFFKGKNNPGMCEKCCISQVIKKKNRTSKRKWVMGVLAFFNLTFLQYCALFVIMHKR